MLNEAKLAQCLDGIVDIQRHQLGMTASATPGQRLLKSQNVDAVKSGQSNLTTRITNMERKAITNPLTVSDPLSQPYRTEIDPGTRRTLKVRDALRSFSITEGSVYMPKKNTVTHGSPIIQPGQNSAVGEADMTFTNVSAPLVTFAHIVNASNQVLDDSANLDALISTELVHGLGLEIEDQILNGDGAGESLDGLLSNASPLSPNSPAVSGATDTIRYAMKQIIVADYEPTHIVLNPEDLYDIDTRTANVADDAAYTAILPRFAGHEMMGLWGLPVIETNSIAQGTFLVGDFARSAVLFDQGAAQISISSQHAQNFTKNMVAIRALERLALVVINPLGLVTGSL